MQKPNAGTNRIPFCIAEHRSGGRISPKGCAQDARNFAVRPWKACLQSPPGARQNGRKAVLHGASRPQGEAQGCAECSTGNRRAMRRAAFSLVTFSWPRKTNSPGANWNSRRLARRAKSMDGLRKSNLRAGQPPALDLTRREATQSTIRSTTKNLKLRPQLPLIHRL